MARSLAMDSLAPTLLVLALAGVYGAGCAHTREAEDASGAEVSQPDGENEEGAAEAPKADAAAQQGASAPGGMVAGGAQDPEEIPVATSAGGLLKPGAEKAVREKLGLKEKGGMRSALQKFQRSHDLPATGMLDHETVEQLGLDPDDVFQRAQQP